MANPKQTTEHAPQDPEGKALESERHELLERVRNALDLPLILLGFVWLVLIVVELTIGLSPFLEQLGYVIWGLFVADFVLEFTVAPSKASYLRRNWLTVLALVAPALRVLAAFRVLRALRALRGLRLLRVVSSVNRGMRSLGRVMQRHGFGYVLSLTALVVAGGAAGIYAFERSVPDTVVTDLGTAVWWTAMVITTMGSDYFPRTSEGRLLCLLLATYGFAVFGYVTATIASVFVARDARPVIGVEPAPAQVERLMQEIGALRTELRQLSVRREPG